jgi:prepilin-type N-terminal cleavage/methylation domain-containing protein
MEGRNSKNISYCPTPIPDTISVQLTRHLLFLMQNRKQNIHDQRGFTLLELLVVVSILAAVAFVATGTFNGASEKANDGIVRAEMQAIVKAIRQFKQDTGYYPKTGPFGLDADGGEIDADDLDDHYGAPSAQQTKWFYSPANFYQLLSSRSPLELNGDEITDSNEHQLTHWNPETGRGWRGPYLHGHNDGRLYIGDDINDTNTDGNPNGDPMLGNQIAQIRGMADPFEQKRYDSDLVFWEYLTRDKARNTFWQPYNHKGRPYLLFDVTTSPWIVSSGSDGEYGDRDDIILYINGAPEF